MTEIAKEDEKFFRGLKALAIKRHQYGLAAIELCLTKTKPMKWIFLILFTPTMLLAPNKHKKIGEISDPKIEAKLKMIGYINKKKKVKTIASIIRNNESNGNYKARGECGEYGAYQYMPNTWRNLSLKYFNRVIDMTPVNQDVITYKRIDELLREGYFPDQIASIWNCGNPVYYGKVGINYLGVKYNVPRYVEKFMDEYNKMI